MFYERGRKMEEHCSRCPILARIFESPECMRTLAGLIYVSRISPGTQIAAHYGPTNLRVRCHLGLKVPAGRCGLEVGGRTTKWVEGKCVVFDDSLEHSVWNLTEEDRVVLIVDLWHPDLTPDEIVFLAGMQEYAMLVAPGLGRYWNMNEQNRTKKRSGYD